MSYNLTSIFEKITQETINEEDCNFSAEELWEWTVFDHENSYLNESLKIHKHSGIPIIAREVELGKLTGIKGAFLLFDFIGHSPSYKLIKLENLQDLANSILSHSGIFNSFTTVQIPIIKGETQSLKEVVKLDLYPNKKEMELINSFQKTLNTEINDKTFYACCNQGRNCIIEHKKKGISQQRSYDTIYAIKLVYRALEINHVDDYIDEILDYICGYIGNKELWIWDKKL